MSVNAKFVGDFSSFVGAVQKANVSLDALEVNGRKVESALQRMTTGFQGQTLIQNALLATEAVKKVGGATALTESEQRKLNIQLTEAIAKYEALGKKAPDDMLALAKATSSTGSATSKWIGDFGTSVAGMATGMISAQAVIGGVQAAFSGLVSFIGSSVSSFAAAEAAEKKMTVALTNMGLATPATVKQMNDLAGSFQKTTIYGDDLISEMQALLIQVGGVAPHAMDAALKASTDLAAGLGIDLEQATTLVAKAFAGNTESLGRYGIKIDEAKLKTEGVTAVLDEVQSRFGGQAAAATETYAGKVAQLANEWDNLKEAVGKFVAESPAVVGVLRDITNLLSGANTESLGWLKTLGQFGVGAFPGLASTLDSINAKYTEANALAAQFRENAALVPSAPASITQPTAPTLGDQSGVVAAQLEEQKQLNAAQKAAESAAKAHADTLRKLREDLYGTTAIAQAKNYTTVVTDVSRLSAEQQAQVNKVVGEGILASQRLGETAPAAMRELYAATVQLPKIPTAIEGIGTAALGSSVKVEKLAAVFPKFTTGPIADLNKIGEGFKQVDLTVEAATIDLGKLIGTFAELGSVAPGAVGTVAGATASLLGVNAKVKSSFTDIAGAAKKFGSGEILSGISGMATGIGGLVTAGFAAYNAIKSVIGLFNKKEGRELVVEFAEKQGGFDALQKKLEALGEEGGQLWVKLTQGVPKNDKAAAAAAIGEVEAALKKAGTAAEQTADVTEVQAQATIETAAEAARALESLKPALAENESLWSKWGDHVTGELQRVADAVRAMPMPAVLTPTASAATMTGSARGRDEGGGGTAVINLDGRQIAEAVVPRIPGVVKRYGLA